MRLGFAFALALVLAATSVVRAEDVVAYEVEGQADAAGADARVAALDDAFARATERALAELVSPDARKAHKADLDREIVARARLWVAKFSVSSDATDDGLRQLSVSVRIDRDKLRARLAELGVSEGDAAPPGPSAPAGKSQSVVILLRVTRPSGAVADYGPDADKDTPGLGVLTSAMRTAGMTIKRPSATAAAPNAAGSVPLDDEAADVLAGEAHTDLALVAGVTVGDALPVRGVAGTATLVSAHVRLVEHGTHKALGDGSTALAALGDDPTGVDRAIDRALAAAAGDVVPAPPPAAHAAPQFRGDDTPTPEPGVVLVHLPPKTPYALVSAEEKFLAGGKGVRAATLHRLSPSGWIIGVTTADSVERVAQLAKKPPATDTAVDVKVAGDIVELSLAGAP